MQGDRTFDNYFGTYPGADGIPADACQALVLNRPAERLRAAVPAARHRPRPRSRPAQTVIDAQLDGGKLDGFVAAYAAQGRDGTSAMGYYDQRDLPFYWNVAQQLRAVRQVLRRRCRTATGPTAPTGSRPRPSPAAQTGCRPAATATS